MGAKGVLTSRVPDILRSRKLALSRRRPAPRRRSAVLAPGALHAEAASYWIVTGPTLQDRRRHRPTPYLLGVGPFLGVCMLSVLVNATCSAITNWLGIGEDPSHWRNTQAGCSGPNIELGTIIETSRTSFGAEIPDRLMRNLRVQKKTTSN